MKQVAVLIPVHNRREVTLRCLERLAADGVDGFATVVVVDDGSTDGTADAIRQHHPTTRILAGDGNLWWGGAMHLGMDTAFREGADCVVWLNDDCLPAPGTLRLLATHAMHTAGAATGWATTPSSGSYGGLRKTSWGLVPVAPPPSGQAVPCDAAGGNCVAISRPVFQAIGLPDAARLPHSLLDVDYLLTATAHRFPLDLLGSAVCHNDDNLGLAASSWLLADASPWNQWRIFLGKRSTFNYSASFHLHTKHWGVWGLWLFARGYLKLVAVCLLRALVPLRLLRTLYANRSGAWQRQRFYQKTAKTTSLPPQR